MHRKLIILSMLIAIAFKATAQQQQIPYYTILLGQTKEWKTGSTIKSIAKGGNAECVKITFQGATANIKGMKLGLVELTATLSNGKTQKCKVRVTTAYWFITVSIITSEQVTRLSPKTLNSSTAMMRET